MDDRTLLDSNEVATAAALERIHDEFDRGFALVAQIDRPAAAVFGSARNPVRTTPPTPRLARSAPSSRAAAGP